MARVRERYLYPEIDVLDLSVRLAEGLPRELVDWLSKRQERESAPARQAIESLVKRLQEVEGGELSSPTAEAMRSNPVRRWAARRVLEVFLGLALGDLEPCPHMLWGKTPFFAFAWSRVTACFRPDCYQTRWPRIRPSPEEDYTCDRCGERAERMALISLSCYELLWTCGLCPGCRREWDGEAG